MKKKYINILILLFFIGVTVYVLVSNTDVEKLPEILREMDIKFFWYALIFMLFYLMLGGFQIQALVKSAGYKVNAIQAFFLSCVGTYYSNITPFATGGQPGQIYIMKKQYGIPVPAAGSVTISKSIVYQVTVTIIIMGVFLYQLPFFMKEEAKILPFIIIGILCNLIAAIFLVFALYNGKLLIKMLTPILNFLKKFRIFKKLEQEKIYSVIHEYSDIMNTLRKKKLLMVSQIIFTISQLIIFFSLTNFIYLGFGNSNASALQIFSLQAILYVVVSFIPTPGGAGASELGFYSIFAPFFTKDIILYAMILWRIISYYFPIVLGGLLSLMNTIWIKRKNGLNTKTRLHNIYVEETMIKIVE